jgi:tripartite-type tricarboxylate transporter receptor subunit TctC
MKPRNHFIKNCLITAFVGIFCSAGSIDRVGAEEKFPEKPIKILVGYTAGGTASLMAHMHASLLTEHFGQPAIVTEKPGAASTIAVAELATSKPDGYTTMHLGILGLTVAPFIIKVKFNSLTDVEPLCTFAQLPFDICVQANAPWNSFKELVEYARQNPGVVTYSTMGVGSNMHLVFEYIGKKENVKWNHVPYPGGAPAVAALLGGHVKVNSGSGSHLPYVKAGKLKILARYMDERGDFPDVPTLKELGYDIPITNDQIAIIPKGVPEPIQRKLEEAFSKATMSKTFIAFAEQLLVIPKYKDRETTRKTIEKEYNAWSKITAELGIKAK